MAAADVLVTIHLPLVWERIGVREQNAHERFFSGMLSRESPQLASRTGFPVWAYTPHQGFKVERNLTLSRASSRATSTSFRSLLNGDT